MNKEEIIEFLKNNLEIRIYENEIYVCNTKCKGYFIKHNIKVLKNDEEISSDSIII